MQRHMVVEFPLERLIDDFKGTQLLRSDFEEIILKVTCSFEIADYTRGFHYLETGVNCNIFPFF